MNHFTLGQSANLIVKNASILNDPTMHLIPNIMLKHRQRWMLERERKAHQ